MDLRVIHGVFGMPTVPTDSSTNIYKPMVFQSTGIVLNGNTTINTPLTVCIVVFRHSLAVFKVFNQILFAPAGELVLIDKSRPMQMNGVDTAEHIVEPVSVKHYIEDASVDKYGLNR